MHEMSIACRLIEAATAALPEGGAGAAVSAVNLRIGKLTAVVPESLRQCFGIASAKTPLAGARLEIEEVPVVLACRVCGEHSQIDQPPFRCRACNAAETDMLSGRELVIVSLELEENPAAASG